MSYRVVAVAAGDDLQAVLDREAVDGWVYVAFLEVSGRLVLGRPGRAS